MNDEKKGTKREREYCEICLPIAIFCEHFCFVKKFSKIHRFLLNLLSVLN